MMIMKDKDLREIPVTEKELGNYSEHPKRVFGVICRDGIHKTKRLFQYKRNLRRWIERPEVSDVQLLVCEVEER